MSDLTNLFENLPLLASDEIFETLLAAKNLKIERIISQGQASPDGSWYDQEQHEWVLLIQGAARIQFENKTVALTPGDFLSIPAHSRHRVEWTDPAQQTIWLAIHYFDGGAP